MYFCHKIFRSQIAYHSALYKKFEKLNKLLFCFEKFNINYLLTFQKYYSKKCLEFLWQYLIFGY